MERDPSNLIIEVMSNTAVDSVVHNDGYTIINKPIYKVEGKNPNSEQLLIIRTKARKKAENLNIPFFYHNFDLEEEVLRIKRTSKIALEKNH